MLAWETSPSRRARSLRSVAAGITTDGERTGYSGLGDEGHDDPAPVAVGLGIQPSIAEHGPESVGKQQRPATAGEIEQGTPVVSAGGQCWKKSRPSPSGSKSASAISLGDRHSWIAPDQRVDD